MTWWEKLQATHPEDFSDDAEAAMMRHFERLGSFCAFAANGFILKFPSAAARDWHRKRRDSGQTWPGI